MRLVSGRNRPVHLGPFPLERLKRGAPAVSGGIRPARPAPAAAIDGLAADIRQYIALYAQFRDGPVAPAKAPIPDDAVAHAHDLKAGGYFLDASMMGLCAIPAAAWYATAEDGTALAPYHRNAVVILAEHPDSVYGDNPAAAWTAGSAHERALMRCTEAAIILAGYVRRLGYAARAQLAGSSDVDLEALALAAGLATRRGDALEAPFIGRRFALAAVTTDYDVAADRPIARRIGPARWLKEALPHLIGSGGAVPQIERLRIANRRSELGPYPMETIKRVDKPTTLVFEDEVPRVSKRAEFFERALQGDLGEKAQKERNRFAHKHPFANAMIPLIRCMVPVQDGAVAPAIDPATQDPHENARGLKALSYFMGSDLTGICEAKLFAYYTHRGDGTPVTRIEKHAIVMVIDQGFETMEGASGDDWISGSQSMRSYLRGAQIAGIMASFIRAKGWRARVHSNADSELVHTPLMMYAGLGELSRIGEVVLNPFIGPRLKTVVITTDMPLEHDKPVDFGLLDACRKCLKCARECPCDAISWGDPVMFNGYEMWKPDVERCVRYRVTNPHGSACGRCMKMCPYNNEGLWYHRLGLKAAIRWPWTRKAIARWDDKVGNGTRNPVKKWWYDLEMIDGVCTVPKGTNARDLDLARQLDPARQKIAYCHANMMPAPDNPATQGVDRKAGLAAAALVESVADAEKRKAEGGAPPAHYRATPPVGQKPGDGKAPVKSVYAIQ